MGALFSKTSDTVLRLSNVSKAYPGTVALNKVNISVKRGEVHGINPPSSLCNICMTSIKGTLFPK